jgi:uncharacterized protein (DUF2062 family)
MVFGRRNPLSKWQHIKSHFWPKSGWQRAFRYLIKRVLRLSASPHVVALGFAVGVFASFTPFIGLHLVIAACLAFLLGGNMLASAIATIIGNPITLPFIWGITFKVGSVFTSHEPLNAPETLDPELSLSGFAKLWPTLKPMMIGAIPIGLAAGALSYFIVRYFVATYQRKRRMTMLERLAHLSHLKDNLIKHKDGKGE